MNGKDIQQLYREGKQLNIAAYSTGTRVLGPGLRAAVWVQGCPRHCSGCIAAEWLAMRPNRLVEPDELASLLLHEPIDGLTLSGGDPMLQAAGLARLVRALRRKKEINVISYTGYLYQELLDMHEPAIDEYLSLIDVLIDGPYMEALNDDRGMRGSSNQQIIHLSDRLKDFDFEYPGRKMEINVRQGEIFAIGVPARNMKMALERASTTIAETYHKKTPKQAKARIRISTERKYERT